MTGDDGLHKDLSAIMQQSSQEVQQSHPPGTFLRAFWDNQHRAAAASDARRMRWDLSSSAYEMVRDSGVIKLPSQRTLRDYTYYTRATIGFSKEVDDQVITAASVHTCPEREKYVLLVMDEMHIREDLVYDKHTGILYVYPLFVSSMK